MCTRDLGLTECINTKGCEMLSDDCEKASPACYYSMLKNDVCDEACNVPECGFDAGKCVKNDVLSCTDITKNRLCKKEKGCKWSKRKCIEKN